MLTALSVPLTEKLPPANSMSSTDASSRWAAIFLPFSMIFSDALTMALPPTDSEREPKVPMPIWMRPVSPSTISTFS